MACGLQPVAGAAQEPSCSREPATEVAWPAQLDLDDRGVGGLPTRFFRIRVRPRRTGSGPGLVSQVMQTRPRTLQGGAANP